ncbi:YidH family protein [Nocardioides hwasunensis]|uniref:YidH family protein n=1 Tax=Nocardioides hwasunensis TaxID=397258 RepID=UPI0029656697|nr:DUF202 domain-containing protein [Nocardioides hwasunensis]
MAERRWPRWVYRAGDEPDYRFSLANERTFLAWIRTALALVATGVAVGVVDLDLAGPVRRGLGATLVTTGFALAIVGWWRWAVSERAMRRGAPLPAAGPIAALVLGAVVVTVGLALSTV